MLTIDQERNDRQIMASLGQRIRAARLNRNLTQAEMATRSGIVRQTVAAIEGGNDVSLTTLVAVLRVLGLTDRIDSLVPEQVDSPMARLQNTSKPRQRARRSTAAPNQEWMWGNEEADQ
ncbi:MAG: helix-turn-helix transcriptional regulator [Actinobacteria bacterium]|nr:helix-turn-helix transcriptional regulator [Actinomycetota bacterium]